MSSTPRTTGPRALIEAIALAARFNSDARALHASRAPAAHTPSPKVGAA